MPCACRGAGRPHRSWQRSLLCSQIRVHCLVAAFQSTMGLCAVLAPGLHLRNLANSEVVAVHPTRFDTLIRSLIRSRSRRDAVRVFSGSLLAGLLTNDLRSGIAKKGKHGEGKKHKKRTTNRCIPTCAGRTCGDDGCGGSCGPCANGVCNAGNCTCPTSGTERCGSGCAQPCSGGQVRNPVTCGCCTPNEGGCTAENQCCSGNCLLDAQTVFCLGRPSSQACQFDAQCNNPPCSGGICGQLAGTECQFSLQCRSGVCTVEGVCT